MEAHDKFDLRDTRNRNWLWARREIVRAHGEDLGPYGVAVYVALASFADTETQSQSKPSINTVAEMLGCSATKVREGIRALYRLGWIDYEERYRDDGSQTSHLFFLLECPVDDPYRTPPPSHSGGAPLQNMEGGASHSEPHGGKGKGREREKGGKESKSNPTDSPETGGPEPAPEGLVGEEKQMAQGLQEKGVSEDRATALASQYAPSRIARQIHHYELKLEKGQDIGPGLLVTLVEEDRKLPNGAGRKTEPWEPSEDEGSTETEPMAYLDEYAPDLANQIRRSREVRSSGGDDEETAESDSEQQPPDS